MGFARHIIGLVIVWVATALSGAAMPMAPTATSQAEFFPHQTAAVAMHADVHFAARAPPTTSANVAATASGAAAQGSEINILGDLLMLFPQKDLISHQDQCKVFQ